MGSRPTVPRRLAGWLLRAYPPSLRVEFGAEMADAVAEQLRAASTRRARLGILLDVVYDCARAWLLPRRRLAVSAEPTNRSAALPVDLRDALRFLRRSPRFAIGAVLMLALGIGASTAILSLADAILFRPLPIPRADRLLQSAFSWSYPDFRDLEAESRAFSAVAAWGYVPFAIEATGDPLQVNGAVVSGVYFAVAHQQALAGRLLEVSDDTAAAPTVVVISERLWDRAFNRDPTAIGRIVNLNRQPVTIIGVVPVAFRGMSLQIAPEVFAPISKAAELSTGFFRDPGAMANRDRVWLAVGGRLADGANAEAAGAEARRIYYSHRATTPQKGGEWFTPLLSQAIGVRTSADLKTFLVLLLSASGLALLLTCATVANLLLVRAEGRRLELAVRAALGAGNARIVRLLAIESLAIGLAGGLAGAAVAAGMLKLLESFALPGQISIGDLRVGLNVTMLLASAALGCVTALLFGLAPIRHAARLDPGRALHSNVRVTARQSTRPVLVGVQVALCVMLLCGSLAFGRAIRHALSLDLGFNVTETSITAIDPSLARYPSERAADIRRRVLEALRARSDVRAAGWAMLRPLAGGFIVNPATDGVTALPNALSDVEANVVTDGYFEAMAIPVLTGRAFTSEDDAAAIVSASLARRVWGDRGAIGNRLSLDDTGPNQRWMSVVGVVGDIHRAVGGPAVPMLYVPSGAAPPAFGTNYLMVRSTGSGAAALSNIRAVLRRIDPALPITAAVPMTDHVAAPLMAHRLGFTLFLLFSGVAASLTAFGLYSVVAAAVIQRRREIGIRVALGAEAGGVMRLVVRQGLLAVAIGVTVGLVASISSGRLIERFLFSLPAVSIGAAAAIVVAITGLASVAMLIPTRRALRIDAATVLRVE